MKTLALLLAATTCLSAESPIGLSFPPGTEPVITKGLPAIRHIASDGKPESLAKAAKDNGTEIFAVIPAAEDISKAFATAYGKSVTHWEILPPAGFDPRMPDAPYDYVKLLTLAHKAARDANPKARTGISIANYDLQFLDACLRDGAAGQFDFVSFSPFPVSPGTDRLMPGTLAAVRKLMTLHGLPAETPVHITLTGPEAQANGCAGEGWGGSRREAEQQAARAALAGLRRP
jgi:hypothetical protein